MLLGGAALGSGAVFAPNYAEQMLGLARPPELASSGPGMGGMLKEFYGGKRVPGVEYARIMDMPPGPAQSQQATDFLTQFADDATPKAQRIKNVLRQTLSDLPSHAKRHPIMMGLGLAGLAGTAMGAHSLGKGIHERHLGGAQQGLGWDDAALAAAGLGTLGAVGGGLYEANRRGMLPKVQITMPDAQEPQ
jgi:hypothetical protein